MAKPLEQLRNIGIIAHIDAGKTTVTERMLFLSGAKHRVGSVDAGTTETDEDPEEQQRGITIYSACVRLKWGQHDINLLDTPGHVDFTAEVERCLRVLDGAVVVFSAREGIEAQSETVWRQADKYGVPRIVFINKMDREGADYEAVLREMPGRLGAQPLPIQIPVGAGPPHVESPFRGVIDLISQEFLQFDAASEGRTVIRSPIPEDLCDDAHLWREQMLETLYGIDSELMDMVLEERQIPPERIRQAIRLGCLQRKVQPLLCGAALHGVGVNPLLDAVGHYLPSPLDRPPVTGTDPEKPNRVLERRPDVNEPFSALVFKILPAKTGDNFWIRVYSGKLTQNSRVLNPGRKIKENVAQLWQIHATKRERGGQMEEVLAGDICCVIGPRQSITGDTLCDTREGILLPGIKFADTVLSVAIEPESTADRKKLSEVLEMLKRQDPTFKAQENAETGQTLISGMGELHLEVIQHRLTRDFGLKVKCYKPRVNYRETIGKSVEALGQCNRQLGATQLFARVRLLAEPLENRSSAVVIRDHAPPESIPDEFRPVILDELRGRAEGGGMIAGFPLSGLRITFLGGEHREEGSDEVAFRIATADAFDQILRQGTPVLLEPMMKLEVITPDQYLGDIVGDLQMRRGIVSGTDTRGALTVITAIAPLKELFGYSGAIRSLSQGRAAASMEPCGYEAAPAKDQEEFG